MKPVIQNPWQIVAMGDPKDESVFRIKECERHSSITGCVG